MPFEDESDIKLAENCDSGDGLLPQPPPPSPPPPQSRTALIPHLPIPSIPVNLRFPDEAVKSS